MANPIDILRAALGDRYQLGEEVGRGGMSVVYRAQDVRHGRDVAVKVVRAELSATLGPHRFIREIQIAARLQHPHILPLYDSGEAEGLLYYVMPYVEGESLRQRLSRELELPIPEAIRIASEVGTALAYAHGQGIVHRDIKPENILLSSGLAIVADFGVARALLEAADDSLTDSGVTVGTPGYMSPEQAGGEQRLDGRSDIYSLGCVLFEMLAGEPPFTGPTPKAVLARHMQQAPPDLHVVRSTVPAALEAVIARALAKVPADRYRTAAEFVTALSTSEHGPRVARFPPRAARMLTTAGAIAAGAFIVWLALRPEPVLDQNKVVVFPLAERGMARADSGVGYDLALVIEAALEHTDPLKWIDGWQRLNAQQRANVALVTSDRATAITRARGARYYLDGVARGGRDSNSVTLRLTDAAGDSLIAQETVTAPAGQPLYQLGLAATRRLLPRVLDPGRRVDLAPLSARKPGAIALFIQGEREYRQSRFGPALAFYQRAVADDSGLAFAAIKGAQAASWINRPRDAEQLAHAAVANQTALPQRHAHFARGLLAYLTGDADSAVYWLERARAAAPEWSEASMALGEVFYHLLPSRAPLDSLAAATFETVAEADSAFSPPLFHLAEIRIRQGDTRRAAAFVDRFRAVEPDPALVRQISLMFECVRRNGSTAAWQAAADSEPGIALVAAKSLAVGLAQTLCAEQGFRTVLRGSSSSSNQRWGAFLGLHGLLSALGRPRDVIALTDSVVAAGMPIAPVLYPLDVIAGVPLEPQAAALQNFARAAFGPSYEGVGNPQLLWLLGCWHAYLGQPEIVGILSKRLAAAAPAPGDRRARLFAHALDAQLVLLRRDTAGALSALSALHPTAPRDSLEWEFGESLPVERLRLAQLLLERGRWEDAYHVATVFDQPGPIIHLAFIPMSLVIRYRAAEALGRHDWMTEVRRRLTAIGREGLIDARITSHTAEVPHVGAQNARRNGTRATVLGL